MCRRLGRAAAIAVLGWWLAALTQARGAVWDSHCPVCSSETHPVHVQNTSLYLLPILVALLRLAEVFERIARGEHSCCLCWAKSVCWPLSPVHRHRNDGSWTTFLDCPPLVLLPDHVFRVASSLQKQQETDHIELLLALLPVVPRVLNCIPVHSLQVWGCCCICREYTWP